MALQDILAGILAGEADGEFDQVYDAIKARQRQTDSIKALGFKKDDRIVFNELARPAYIRGQTGKVASAPKRGAKSVMVILDEAAGRYSDERPIRTPVSIIERVK